MKNDTSFHISEVLAPKQIKSWMSRRASTKKVGFIVQQIHDGVPVNEIKQSKNKKHIWKVIHLF